MERGCSEISWGTGETDGSFTTADFVLRSTIIGSAAALTRTLEIKPSLAIVKLMRNTLKQCGKDMKGVQCRIAKFFGAVIGSVENFCGLVCECLRVNRHFRFEDCLSEGFYNRFDAVMTQFDAFYFFPFISNTFESCRITSFFVVISSLANDC